MIVKWDGPEGIALHDDVIRCVLFKADESTVKVSLWLRNGDEVAFEVQANVFVMNDDGVTIDRAMVRH